MKERPYIDYIRRLSTLETKRMESRIVRSYQRVRSFLVLWLRGKGLQTVEDAEDVAGQVWTELVGAVRSRQLRQWSDGIVYHIARNRFLDQVYGQRNHARLIELRRAELVWLIPNWNLSNVSDTDSDIPICCPDLDDEILISKLLASLPDKERAVIEDLYIEGRTLTESAKNLKVSTSTVKRLQSRALIWMRSQVG